MDDATPHRASDRRLPGTLGSLEVFGIPVRFHFTFWLIVVWLIVVGSRGTQSAVGMTLYILAIFGSVLLHEVGHALVARRFGIKTLEIVMLPIGGLARLERQPKAREEFWVALAGPMVNLVLAGIAVAASLGAPSSGRPAEWLTNPSDANLLGRVAVANLILAVFNLLPAFPMDGGRVLRSVLARRRSEQDATRIAARIGMALAAVMGLYGLLAADFLLVFVAFFIYVGAMQESMATQQQALIRGELVRAAMITDFRTLKHGDTIRDAAELLLATSQQDFPVLTGSSVVGLLNRTSLLRAMAAEGPEAYVAGAMDREFVRVTPEMELSAAVPLLTGGNSSCALVFEEDALIGMLTAENLSEFLMLREIRQARRNAGLPEQ
jgi:Zn-dependent protease